tara:strand:+ start:299 stop:484 length:186 start_codon:yes stop_codon:yes gene_type:complete
MGVPTNVLREGLGHSDLATKEAYIDRFEDKVVNEANDKITFKKMLTINIKDKRKKNSFYKF